MSANQVDKRNGCYYVAGSRVSLASIVYEFKDGASVETIRENFPTLSVPQINAAIDFYHANRVEVESYLRALEESWKTLEASAQPVDPALEKRIEEARKRVLAKPA